MTGLQPEKVWHSKYFDVSMETIHHALAIVALLFAVFVTIKFFLAYFIAGIICAVAVTMAIEFFSDWHRSNNWGDD